MEVVLERAQHMSSVQKARRFSPAMPNLTSPDPCAGPGSLAMRDGDEVMLDPQLVLELEGEFQVRVYEMYGIRLCWGCIGCMGLYWMCGVYWMYGVYAVTPGMWYCSWCGSFLCNDMSCMHVAS